MKLHLGCGKRVFPGFVHVDLADFPHIDHRCSIAQLDFAADASADLIYTSHTLEYFDRVQADTVLREWFRVLRPGGVLRLAVPDFPALAEVYRQTGRLELILGPLYGRMPVTGTTTTIYHRTVYDFPSLEAMLHQAGYINVRRYDWRATSHAEFDDHSQAYFPHMDKDHGRLISLNVECDRPLA